MPELPEVETIRRGVETRAVGRSVLQVQGTDSRLFRHNPKGLASVVEAARGREVAAVQRRGKFMWLVFRGKGDALVVHLGMSGTVRVTAGARRGPGLDKHEHLRFRLGETTLGFIDQRTFGHYTVSPLRRQGGRLVPEFLRHVAPDPLEPEFDFEVFLRQARRSRRRVKTLLLDQTFVSGIGNIYADEGLFWAGLPGTVRARDLTESQWERLVAACADVMRRALSEGGTSFDALYVDADGNPGYFSRKLAVYGRAGSECPRDGHPIQRRVVDGRSHFFCPECQGAGG